MPPAGAAAELLDAYQPELLWTTTSCGYPCSDHASWFLNGYDTAFPFEAGFFDHNPWIHTENDTLGTLGNSVAHAAKFARLAAAFMVEVAKTADVIIFADGFETGTTEGWPAVVP
jgi:bacterial leucyl aminopeptidase